MKNKKAHNRFIQARKLEDTTNIVKKVSTKTRDKAGRNL
jgi:hypothetical protein